MTKTSPKTAPNQIADDRLEDVQDGLIGLLRPSAITDGTSESAGLTKVGTGTLTLGSGNTYNG